MISCVQLLKIKKECGIRKNFRNEKITDIGKRNIRFSTKKFFVGSIQEKIFEQLGFKKNLKFFLRMNGLPCNGQRTRCNGKTTKRRETIDEGS